MAVLHALRLAGGNNRLSATARLHRKTKFITCCCIEKNRNVLHILLTINQESRVKLIVDFSFCYTFCTA
ncbi:Senescence-associated protein SPA15, chloroplastic [Dirofilaria immitis]